VEEHVAGVDKPARANARAGAAQLVMERVPLGVQTNAKVNVHLIAQEIATASIRAADFIVTGVEVAVIRNVALNVEEGVVEIVTVFAAILVRMIAQMDVWVAVLEIAQVIVMIIVLQLVEVHVLMLVALNVLQLVGERVLEVVIRHAQDAKALLVVVAPIALQHAPLDVIMGV
jgi:hypothetical protein